MKRAFAVGHCSQLGGARMSPGVTPGVAAARTTTETIG